MDDPQKKIDAANTALNRLMAGDFLESLGKELGLEVPPDMPPSISKPKNQSPKKESNSVNPRKINSSVVGNMPSSISTAVKGTSASQEALHDEGYGQESMQGIQSRNDELTGSPENGPDKVAEKVDQEDRKAKTQAGHHQNWSRDSSSEDERERSRKHSRRRRQRSDSSDGDLSSDHRDRHHSRSNGRKKGSSREKSGSSRKHSKHHRDRSRERERSGSKREKR